MKNLLFSLTAMVMVNFTGNAQNIKDLLVRSQSSVTKTTEDGYYSKFVSKAILPKGIHLINNEKFSLYTLNDANYKMLEIPVLSDTNIANVMFAIIDVKLNTSKIIFKNHQRGSYEFFNENLEKLYLLKFTDKNIEFTNENETSEKVSCYSACRSAAYAEIEGDWLSDLACSINPCGAAIAVYCAIQCR
jgi:hypothetical protein